ncbi:pr158 [rat cytomegalovirus strain Maastricht]|uniref:Pr158 n=1 Tax=Rat cytomegalovirus (strain Maastricht) TaxID=79700 RepID=Q9DW33_RCMVM|nr:pr158 [rat cytomegalovirus strain Maastricht]AAF99257.1 pr158 [rat cytomegalovirus strain Maastricht]WEG72078.1 membrane protein r164 [Murid betaherpesvirus 2]
MSMFSKCALLILLTLCRVSTKSKFQSATYNENGTNVERNRSVITTVSLNGIDVYRHVGTLGGFVVFIIIVTVVFILCRDGLPHRQRKKTMYPDMALSFAATQTAYVSSLMLE